MKKQYSIYLFCLFLVVCSCKNTTKEAEVLAAFPDADAVFLEMKKEYSLNDDGSVVYHYFHRVKLLTNLAFTRLYGETFIDYNPLYQELKVNRSVTYMADGKEVASPSNAFNEILPSYASDAPAYNHLRTMVVSHTGLEENAIVELDYSITNKKGFLPALMINELLPAESPVGELQIQISLPEKNQLHYQLLNSSTKPLQTKEKGRSLFCWKFQNLPALSKEEKQVAVLSDQPRLLVSNASEIDLKKFFADQTGFHFKASESIKKKADEMKKEFSDEEKLSLQLNEFVVNEFAYYPVPILMTGFRARTADEVWLSNGGTNLEKALLLSTLLQAAGVKSEVVGSVPSSLQFKNIFNLAVYNEIFVQAKLNKGNYLLLSPIRKSNQNNKYKLAEDDYLIFSLTGHENTIHNITKNNILSVSGQLEISNKKILSGTIQADLSNLSNPYFELLKNKDHAAGMLTAAKIKHYNIKEMTEGQSSIEYIIDSPEPFRSQANYLFWTIPSVNCGFASWNAIPLPSRRYSLLQLPFTIEEKYNYTVSLPDHLSLVSPVKIEEKTEDALLFIEIKQEQNKLIITRSLTIYRNIIKTSGYEKFRKIYIFWLDKKYSEVVLKENKPM